jgi:hypothetical protein
MQLKTILNRIQKHRGFVYGDVRLLAVPSAVPSWSERNILHHKIGWPSGDQADKPAVLASDHAKRLGRSRSIHNYVEQVSIT